MAPPRTTAESFNLDDFERSDKAGPFMVTLGGEDYTLVDVQDLDYRELLEAYERASAGDYEPAIQILVHVDEREAFFANKLPSYKLEELFNRYNEHFGINPKKANASPPYSRGTGRQ